MRSNTWRALFLLSLTLILVSTAMDAQAARRSALAGNQFINDADDMFAFPQLIMEYKNRIIIDMGPSTEYYDQLFDEYYDIQNGNGSIIFGDNFVWNFNTGRGDFLNNTASWALGGADRYPMALWNGLPGNDGFNGSRGLEWWDLGVATHLGDTPFGFNVSWATDKLKYEEPGVDTLEMKTNMLSFQLGATFGSVDLAGEVGFGDYTEKGTGADPSDYYDNSFFNFALLARGDLEDVGGLDWRWIASFANGSQDPKMTDAIKLSSTAFRASFGPVWGTPGEWEVAAYMNFAYVSNDETGENGIEYKDTMKYTSFPGYNLAMEYYLNSWLVARGGVASHNATDTYTTEASGGDEEGSVRNYEFYWTLGLGVDKGTWGLDLALQEDEVFSGYLPFNGSTSQPLAYMTAWLAW